MASCEEREIWECGKPGQIWKYKGKMRDLFGGLGDVNFYSLVIKKWLAGCIKFFSDEGSRKQTGSGLQEVMLLRKRYVYLLVGLSPLISVLNTF